MAGPFLMVAYLPTGLAVSRYHGWVRCLHLTALALLLAPLSAASNATWIEFGVSHYDPDWELRERETGARIAAKLTFDRWSVNGFVNTIATARVDEPVVRLRGLPFERWRELGGGYRLNEGNTTLAVGVSYVGVRLDERVRSGYWAGLTVTQDFGTRLEGALRVAHFDLTETDIRLTGELSYRASDKVAVVFRVDDFNEFDFTWYELGVRFSWR